MEGSSGQDERTKRKIAQLPHQVAKIFQEYDQKQLHVNRRNLFLTLQNF